MLEITVLEKRQILVFWKVASSNFVIPTLHCEHATVRGVEIGLSKKK